MEEFQKCIPSPLFIFRPEMLNFHPYSILTGDTRVEFVIYRVLSNLSGSFGYVVTSKQCGYTEKSYQYEFNIS